MDSHFQNSHRLPHGVCTHVYKEPLSSRNIIFHSTPTAVCVWAGWASVSTLDSPDPCASLVTFLLQWRTFDCNNNHNQGDFDGQALSILVVGRGCRGRVRMAHIRTGHPKPP
jgi:hypothetical protein